MDAGMNNGGMMCGAGGVDHSLGSASVSGSGGFVAPARMNSKQIDMYWSDEEQAVLEHCLAKYAGYNTTSISLYARISLQLNNKTVRDVAMRCRWLSKREKAKKKKEDKKERSIDNAASSANSNIISKPGFSPYASQRTATNNNNSNGSSVFFNATVQLLHHNSRVFDQISANLTSNQIQDNIVLLRYARNNLFNILSDLNEQQSFISRMPPLPVELNDELANSILAPASTCPPWK